MKRIFCFIRRQKAFDELGLKKIPTVKSLQAEYAQLLEEKKKAYGEFRRPAMKCGSC